MKHLNSIWGKQLLFHLEKDLSNQYISNTEQDRLLIQTLKRESVVEQSVEKKMKLQNGVGKAGGEQWAEGEEEEWRTGRTGGTAETGASEVQAEE